MEQTKKNEDIFDIMDILSEKQNGISVEWYGKCMEKLKKAKLGEMEWNRNGTGMEMEWNIY